MSKYKGCVFEQEAAFVAPGGPLLDRSRYGQTVADTAITYTRLPSGLYVPIFDGATSLITVTDAASLQRIFDGEGGSLELWVNPASDGETNIGRFLDKREPNPGWFFRVQGEAAGRVDLLFLHDFTGDDGIWTSTATAIPLNTWSKVTLTYSSAAVGNDPLVYIDGASVGMTQNSIPTGIRNDDSGDNLIIGNNGGVASTFDGNLVLVRLRRYILTAGQILKIFEAERSLFGV